MTMIQAFTLAESYVQYAMPCKLFKQGGVWFVVLMDSI